MDDRYQPFNAAYGLQQQHHGEGSSSGSPSDHHSDPPGATSFAHHPGTTTATSYFSPDTPYHPSSYSGPPPSQALPYAGPSPGFHHGGGGGSGHPHSHSFSSAPASSAQAFATDGRPQQRASAPASTTHLSALYGAGGTYSHAGGAYPHPTTSPPPRSFASLQDIERGWGAFAGPGDRGGGDGEPSGSAPALADSPASDADGLFDDDTAGLDEDGLGDDEPPEDDGGGVAAGKRRASAPQRPRSVKQELAAPSKDPMADDVLEKGCVLIASPSRRRS